MRASFEAGLKEYLALVSGWVGGTDRGQAESKAMAILSAMVGAVLLARAVNDPTMSKQFLRAAAGSVMDQTAPASPGPQPQQ